MRALLFALDGILKKADQAPTTVPSRFRVAHRYLLARLGAEYDMLARLSVLEGVAAEQGISPGTWVKLGARRGMQEASAYFGNLHPSWTKTGESGLLKRAEMGVNMILGEAGGGIPDLSTEDIIQSYLAGMKPFTLRPATPLLYEVGNDVSKHEKEGVFDGSVVVRDFFGKAYTFFMNRARDELRSYMVHPARGRALPMVLPSGESAEELIPGEIGDLPGELLAEVLSDARDPIAKRVRKILRKINELNRPALREVFRRYLDFVEANPNIRNVDKHGFPWGMATALGKEMGKSHTVVSRQLKEALRFVIDRAQKNPTLMRMLREILEQPAAELGYGGAIPMRVAASLMPAFVKVACGCSAGCLAEEEGCEGACMCGEDGCMCGEEDEIQADRIVQTGPEGAWEATIGKIPGAGQGAYRFAQKLAARYLETK